MGGLVLGLSLGIALASGMASEGAEAVTEGQISLVIWGGY